MLAVDLMWLGQAAETGLIVFISCSLLCLARIDLSLRSLSEEMQR